MSQIITWAFYSSPCLHVRCDDGMMVLYQLIRIASTLISFFVPNFALVQHNFRNTSNILHLDHRFSFNPFIEALRQVKLNANSVPKLTASSHLYECSLPKHSVIFTYATKQSVVLIHSYLKAMEINNIRNCLLQHFIFLCFDEKCCEVCKDESLPFCPLIDLSTQLVDGSYGKESYYFLTYIKHELLQVALYEVEHVLFIDLDVLVFYNPWKEILFPFDRTRGKRVSSPYNFRYQPEMSKNDSCEAPINTGFLYLRNTNATQNFLKLMSTYKDKIVRLRRGSDQKFANKIYASTPTLHLQACALPATRFASKCLAYHDNFKQNYGRKYTAGDIITFHATCVEGTLSKMFVLNRVLYAAQHNRSSPLIDVLTL